jgi:asparagine synthase (glutamine-hydrolysing)
VLSPATQITVAENSLGNFDYFETDELIVCLKGHLWANEAYDTIITLPVIAKAFQHQGNGFIAHFTGNFSLLLYSKKDERIIVYTDQYGTIPIYYTSLPKGIVIATEYESLRHIYGVDFLVNKRAFSNFMHYGTTLTGHTLIKNLNSLLPSSILVWDKNGLSVSPYHHAITPSSVSVD